MAILGFRDTRSLVMLDGWDATALRNYQLQDGTTFDRVVAELNMALQGVSAELFSDPALRSPHLN